MQQSISTILFDFDGTLVNTSPGIVATMREVLLRMHITPPSDTEMCATIGLPLGTALRRIGNLSQDKEQEAVDLYRQLFVEYELSNLDIFPNVVSTLRVLQQQGIRMGIVTSRDKESLDMIMQPRGLHPFFEIYATANDHLQPKPAPDMVLTLLERMHVGANETLVVGDTSFDIEMGNNACCRTCAVTYGNHSREQLQQSSPTFMIDDFQQLKSIVLNV